MMFINIMGGVLEYESDGVPTGERKWGIGVGFRRENGHWLWDPKNLGTFLV